MANTISDSVLAALKKYPLGFRLARIMWLKRHLIDTGMKTLNMTRAQWQTLHWINMLNPCTQKQLLNYMDIDGGQLARTLDEFEKNNIIKRKALAEDRRVLVVELTTDAKKKLIPNLEKMLEKESAILLNNVSNSEKEMLISILEKMETNINHELSLRDSEKNTLKTKTSSRK